MLLGVLRMPEEMITGSPLSLVQFINRAREAADRIESDATLITELLDTLRLMMDWSAGISDEYLDGDPELRLQYREDRQAARDLIAKATGAQP